jgi:hypothetical protein
MPATVNETPIALRTGWQGLPLVAGSLLVLVAGVLHPMLTGTAAQLNAIAATRLWRAIHWSFAFGYVISVGGVAAPHVTDVRGFSMFGMSFVYVIFEEGTDVNTSSSKRW